MIFGYEFRVLFDAPTEGTRRFGGEFRVLFDAPTEGTRKFGDAQTAIFLIFG